MCKIATKWANISRRVWSFISQAADKTANINRLYIACLFEQLEQRALMSVNLTTSVVGPNSVELNWTNNAPATGYFILRATDSAHFTTLAKVVSPSAVSFIDTSALSGHGYQYEVQPYLVTTLGFASNMATATTPLAAPASLHGTVSPASVMLGWTNKEATAQGYYVLRATDGGSYSQIAQISAPKTVVYNDTTVSSDHTYSYQIEAYNGSNVSAVSNTLSATTPLAAPTGFAGAAASFTSIQLNWTDHDSNAAGYHVLRANDGVHFGLLTDLNTSDANSYTDNTVVSGHTYTYEIQAFNGNVTSSIIKSTAVSTPLAAPSGAATSVKGPTSVQVTWTDNDLNAAGYTILRATDSVHFTSVGKVASGTAVTFTDNTAASAHTYQYEVEAYNGTIVSPASNVPTASTPIAPPATLIATAIAPGSVKLTWANKEPLATGFYVFRADDGVTFNQIAQITSAKTLTYTDATASSDHAYSYRVKAYINNSSSDGSNTASVTAPLIAPSGFSAVAQDFTAMQLSWTDNDQNAAGYDILKSTDGIHFTTIAQLNTTDASSYTDSNVVSGHDYYYGVVPYNNGVTSLAPTLAVGRTPLAAPSGLTLTNNSSTSVQLNWTDHDSNATSYVVLRSLDGNTFTQLSKVTGGGVHTFADATAKSGTTYYYKVEAANLDIVSPATDAASTTTPLLAPTSVAATPIGSSVKVSWVKADVNTTGYYVFSSTDGSSFTQIAQITSAATLSYIDSSVTAGVKYWYKVQAYNAVASSAQSTAAIITTPIGQSGGVAITMRYGNELVVTATGQTDSISITESGSTLSIVGDGQTFIENAPAAGVFVYTRGGSDSVNVDSSVTAVTTVDTIDGASTLVNSTDASANIWVDSTDTFNGTGNIHRVASFAGGVSKAVGAALANPHDAGSTTVVNASLWGTGPVAADINQGAAGDCYFLSTLAAFAQQQPQTLMNSAVDLGDGTYAVQFFSANGTPTFVRVNDQFSAGGFNGLKYDHPGANGDIWGMVLEKAFCDFRTGANTYASINSGWMGSVYTNLGVNSNFLVPSNFSEQDLFTRLQADLAANKPVTMGTSTAPDLVSDHAYTLVSVSQDNNGVTHYVVRNPWGVSGDSLENSQGLATLTFAQFKANFVEICEAA